MKHLKDYKQFEGFGSWLRGKIHSDEKTAEGILSEMDSLSKSEISEIPESGNDYFLVQGFNFTLDDFDVKILQDKHFVPAPERNGGWVTYYSLNIDDVRIKCSKHMSKKIYKKAEYIFKTTEREELKRRQEDADYIRKDAKIHFSKDGKN